MFNGNAQILVGGMPPIMKIFSSMGPQRGAVFGTHFLEFFPATHKPKNK